MRILKEEDIYLRKRLRNDRIGSIISILLAILCLWLSKIISSFIFVGTIILIGVGMAFLTDSTNWSKGIRGEKDVTDALRHLDDSYILINDVNLPYGYGNIDHVILGPTGIFAIETKNYTGETACLGDDWFKEIGGEKRPIKSISKQVKRNAVTLSNFLIKHCTTYFKGRSPYVNPLIVFTNSNMKLDLHNPTVPIVQLKNLCSFITDNRSKISIKELEDVEGTILRFL